LAFVVLVLLITFAYALLIPDPEPVTGWDVGYFFSHGAFFVLFAMGFISGFFWKKFRVRRTGLAK
jgi:hypothetical protein